LDGFSTSPSRAQANTTSTSPFIGRQSELALLKSALDSAEKGSPRIVLIGGEAGLGKTRLLREMRPIFEAHGAVLYGRCYEDATIPYLPFAEILRTITELEPQLIPDTDPPDREILERLLGRGDLDHTPDLGASDDRRALLFAAVGSLLLRLAASRPLIILIDDLHWMDGPSLELLTHLAFPMVEAAIRRPVPILLMATYRPDGLDQRSANAVDRLQREDACETAALQGLSEFEVEQLIRGVGFERPSHQFVVTIAEATRGNPLFVQEALSYLQSSNAIEKRGGYLVVTVPPTDLKLPTQLTDIISVRTAALAPEARRILTLGAFLGDSFSYATLCAVSNAPEGPLLDILDRAVRDRFLANEGDGFRFGHPLIRHVLYSDVSLPRRHRLHKQIADGLRKLHDDELEQHIAEVAHHLMNCGAQADPEIVLEYCRSAGEQAMGVYAWGEAARHLEAAVTAARSIPSLSVPDLAHLHHRAGFAYYRDLDIGPSLDHYREAIDRFRSIGDKRALVTTLIQYAKCRITQASVAFGSLADVELLEELLQDLGEEDVDLRAQTLAQLSQVYWTARQSDKAESTAREALELAESMDNDQTIIEACSSLGLACVQKVRLRDALESYRRGLEVARGTGDPWLMGWPLARIPLVQVWLGDLKAVDESVTEGTEVMLRSQDWAELTQVYSAAIATAVVRGDFKAAERLAYDGMAATDRSRYPWGAAIFLPALACARAIAGEWEEAEDAIEVLQTPGRIFEEPGPAITGISYLYLQLMRSYRQTLQHSLELEATVARLLDGGRTDVASVAAYAVGIELVDAVGLNLDVANAEAHIMRAAQGEMVISSGWIFLLPRILALASATSGRLDEAESRLGIALEVARGIGARPEQGRVNLDWARLLLKRKAKGDRERAEQLVAEASRLFQELGMTPFTAQATAVATEMEAALPSAPPGAVSYPDRLSAREMEVLQLVARGRSNQQIADQLVLSAKTIARHMSNIFDKIGVENRSGATAYAFRKGLITTS